MYVFSLRFEVRLKTQIETQHKHPRSRIEIVINSTADFRICAVIVSYHKRVLDISADSKVALTVKQSTYMIGQIDIIHSQKRSVLHIVIRQNVLIVSTRQS